MQHVISSGLTVFYKLVLPSVSVLYSVFLVVVLLHNPSDAELDGLIVSLMSVGAAVFFCWYGVRLKQVRIDDHKLYVAGFFKEISVPLTGIASVGGFYNGSAVVLRLKERSEFGRTILFAAKWRPVLPWEHHPIFGELTEWVNGKQPS